MPLLSKYNTFFAFVILLFPIYWRLEKAILKLWLIEPDFSTLNSWKVQPVQAWSWTTGSVATPNFVIPRNCMKIDFFFSSYLGFTEISIMLWVLIFFYFNRSRDVSWTFFGVTNGRNRAHPRIFASFCFTHVLPFSIL